MHLYGKLSNTLKRWFYKIFDFQNVVIAMVVEVEEIYKLKNFDEFGGDVI